jgi:hypothetical protein
MNEIFRSDRILQFWPSPKQTEKERVMATTRFILYLSCILYIIRRDVRILIVGALSLGALYYMYKNGMISSNVVQEPSIERQTNKERWDTIHPYMEGRWFSEHNFYTAPDMNNSDFIDGAYGGMRIPRCRDDSRYCNPDSRWGRGAEETQMRGVGVGRAAGATS